MTGYLGRKEAETIFLSRAMFNPETIHLPGTRLHLIHDHIAQTKFRSWLPHARAWHDQFSPDELRVLRESLYRFDPAAFRPVFLSYENRLASHGGLGAVARIYPRECFAHGLHPVAITPYHANHAAVKRARKEGELTAVFRNLVVKLASLPVRITCYRDTTLPWPSFHLAVADCFQGAPSPYDVSADDDLLRDSCLFGAIVAPVLKHLGYRSNLVLHANDWETATALISLPIALLDGTLQSARSILTLHNSYDSPLSAQDYATYWGRQFSGRTVLESAINLLCGPLTTVSAPFAAELRSDPLQRALFAPHLQQSFSRNPPIGIENGPFTPTDATQAQPWQRAGKTVGAVIAAKRKARSACDQVLGYAPAARRQSGTAASIPLFFMSGRLDMAQKGFDVIFEAFSRLPGGSARLLFSPTPSRNDSSESMTWFAQRAAQSPNPIDIRAERIPEQDYRTILAGASFLVMPSFYEPFGAVSEGFAHGTPVIGRATGGILSQLIPAQMPPLPHWLKRWGLFGQQDPNGILYREQFESLECASQWAQLLKAPPAKRCEVALFDAMVSAAYNALEQACAIYADEKKYAHMIAAGVQSDADSSWSFALELYHQAYETAARFRIS